MNRHVLQALARDAFAQVLDNWVFRILAWLTLLPILATFVIGLREDGLVLLFGAKSWSYQELFGSFQGGASLVEQDPQGILIENVLAVVFEFLAGSLGLLIALAATAAFVPQMLEKGAAELLFHRPVSRSVLFLSRYAAGLLFIAAVSFLLVSGMYVGLRVASQHDDPGIFVAGLSLTYVFGLVYSFSMLVGVVTRSTVAAMLLSILFFFFNGCVHNAWIWKQQAHEGLGLVTEQAEESAADDAQDTSAEIAGASDDGAGAGMTILRTVLDTVHVLLPKTTDADHLAKRLRKEVAPPAFRDRVSLVQVTRLPLGVEPAPPPTELGVPRELLGEPLGAWSNDGTAATRVTYSLWRRPAEKSVTQFGERTRERTENSSQAASSLQDVLKTEAGSTDVARESVRLGRLATGGNLTGTKVTWREAAASRAREALVFRGADSDHLVTLLVDAEGDLAPPELATVRERFSDKVTLDVIAPDEWYSRKLSFTSPWPYNTAFSLGSSIAFAAVMLALGCWRLSRMAF